MSFPAFSRRFSVTLDATEGLALSCCCLRRLVRLSLLRCPSLLGVWPDEAGEGPAGEPGSTAAFSSGLWLGRRRLGDMPWVSPSSLHFLLPLKQWSSGTLGLHVLPSVSKRNTITDRNINLKIKKINWYLCGQMAAQKVILSAVVLFYHLPFYHKYTVYHRYTIPQLNNSWTDIRLTTNKYMLQYDFKRANCVLYSVIAVQLFYILQQNSN